MERTEDARTSASDLLGAEERYRLLVEISAAANSQLELSSVLGEVAEALAPFIAVDAVSVVTIDGGSLVPHAIHLKVVEHRRGDSFADVIAR